MEDFSARGFERARRALRQLDMADALIEQGFSQLSLEAEVMAFHLSIITGPTAPPLPPLVTPAPPTPPPMPTVLPTEPQAEPTAPPTAPPNNEEDLNDDRVPIALMTAAAEDIVDAAGGGGTIDDNLICKTLLRFVEEGDLQETALQEQDVIEQSVVAATAAHQVQHETVSKRRTWHVFHDGRWWQWTALVRAHDGYIKVTDRGRAARFWNVMAAHYQSLLEYDGGTCKSSGGASDGQRSRGRGG